MTLNDADLTLLSQLDRVRRQMVTQQGVKGSGAEREYSIIYDKLAMRGIGNRRRLRAKYRG